MRNDFKAANNDCTTFEHIWIEITINRIKYYIGGYYRHPNTSIKEFKECLESTLDKVKHKKRIIFCGDMNINLNNYNNDNSTTAFVNGIICYNFLPYILLPTGITSYCATIIDHVYSNLNFSGDNYCKSGLLCSDISDHCGNFMFI